MLKKIFTESKGQAALIAILIIAAAIVIVALSLSSNSLNEMILGSKNDQGSKALQIADACVDEAALRLRRVTDGDEPNYTGGTLTFGTDSCTINIINQGDNRVVDVTALVNNTIQRKIRAVFQVSPAFTYVSWQEQP